MLILKENQDRSNNFIAVAVRLLVLGALLFLWFILLANVGPVDIFMLINIELKSDCNSHAL